MEEIVDIVDKNDRVVGSAPRKGIHKTGRLHRAAHIFLIDSKGRIWLELRSASKDIFPLHYSSSAAGHISTGETYLQGAQREVEEELGIKGLKLEQQYKLEASHETANEFIMFYIARSDQRPVKQDDAETEKLELFTVEQIDAMIKRGEKMSPVLLKLFAWYKDHKET